MRPQPPFRANCPQPPIDEPEIHIISLIRPMLVIFMIHPSWGLITWPPCELVLLGHFGLSQGLRLRVRNKSITEYGLFPTEPLSPAADGTRAKSQVTQCQQQAALASRESVIMWLSNMSRQTKAAFSPLRCRGAASVLNINSLDLMYSICFVW